MSTSATVLEQALFQRSLVARALLLARRNAVLLHEPMQRHAIELAELGRARRVALGALEQLGDPAALPRRDQPIFRRMKSFARHSWTWKASQSK